MRKKIFCISIILFLFLLGVKILFFSQQETISYFENRDLSTNADLKVNEIISGRFQENLENILVDQFPNRFTFVRLKNKLDYNSVSILYDYLDNPLMLNPISDSIYQLGNSNVLTQEVIEYSDEVAERIRRRIEQMNQLQRDYPDIKMVVYKPTQLHETSLLDKVNGVEGAGKYYSDIFKNELELDYDEFEISSIEQYKDCFYWTDNHWNHLGSYIGYTQIMKLLFDDEADILVPQDISDNNGLKFYGTFSSRSGYVTDGSPFYVYRFDLPSYDMYNLDGWMEISNTNTFFDTEDHNEMDYHYNIAYKVGDGFTKIVTPGNEDKENLLVIGDSYAGPILPLLAKDFYEITLIYPLNYTALASCQFNYDWYIDENKINKILFMYTIENYFYSDTDGDRYLEFDIIREEK